jgi:hypothetical protein
MTLKGYFFLLFQYDNNLKESCFLVEIIIFILLLIAFS